MWCLLFALTVFPWTKAISYQVQKPPLDTNWTYSLGDNPWPEYPRPQMIRDRWQSLNGIWSYRSAASLKEVNSPPRGELERGVMVPSCLESGLSGLMLPVGEAKYSWLRTEFTVPQAWSGDNVLINFGAVDYEATVFVNGQNATCHRGGYTRFSADITQYIKTGQANELVVFVYDPTDSEGIAVGKQTLKPSHIFYTPCSGIWQSVFIEPVPKSYIDRVDVTADMNGLVNVTVHALSTQSDQVQISVLDSGTSIAEGSGAANAPITFNVPSPRLWSPSSPNLYNLTVTLGNDTVTAYTGFRTIGKGDVAGVTRPKLNGEFILAFGTLDQGYWPDGLYTPPNRAAMVSDVQYLKDLGFNMLRKHIKVETDLFYRACDELGMLVIQDMPSLVPSLKPNVDQQTEWERQLTEMINLHRSFPSIYTWIIYNEGWGQLDVGPETGLTPMVQALDPSRLVDSTSGWNDHGAGDYSDNHHYPAPECGAPFSTRPSSPYDPRRIGFQGEFGGIGNNVSVDHLWNDANAIGTINETYRLQPDIPSWNQDTLSLLETFQQQIEQYSCSGGVWTQTTDVEGEVNGLMTYDRRVSRPYQDQWKAAIQALYDAASIRANSQAQIIPSAAQTGIQSKTTPVVPTLPPDLQNSSSLGTDTDTSGRGHACRKRETGLWGFLATVGVFAGLAL